MASMAEPNRKSDIPPPIIEKAGRYTVFISSPPMASPRSSPKPSPKFSPKPSPKSSLKPSPRPSKNADVEAQASPKTTQCKMPRDSFYTKVSDTINKIQNAYIRVDEVLADCFGLNQSKYQWALNEYMERKEMETEDGKPREAVVKGQEMQQVLEQVMKSMEKYQKNITENVLEKASLAGGSSSSNQKAMDLVEHRRSAMDSASTMTTNNNNWRNALSKEFVGNGRKDFF